MHCLPKPPLRGPSYEEWKTVLKCKYFPVILPCDDGVQYRVQCYGIKRNPTADAHAPEQDIPAKSLRIQRDMVAFGWFAALEKSSLDKWLSRRKNI